MNISFDSAKNQANLSKHGITLGDAALIDWLSAITWLDVRHDYVEPRQCGIGYIGQRLFYIVFVDREQTRRIISLRKANTREVNHYAHT